MEKSKQLFGWAAEEVSNISAALEDGVQIMDGFVLFNAISKRPDFKEVWPSVLSEVETASDDEIADLQKYFNGKLELENKRAEVIAERSFAALMANARLGFAIKNAK